MERREPPLILTVDKFSLALNSASTIVD